MKLYTFEQRTFEWYAARAGVVTASEIDALVSPTWKVRESSGVESYLARKLAERWMGGSMPSFVSEAMEYGIEMEGRAFEFYQTKIGQPIAKIGFITDDKGHIGCSPDGLIGDTEGLEIKCPTAEIHVSYLLGDEIPKDYMAQVQFNLYVSGRKKWHFLSYRPGFPPFIKIVRPDKDAFAAFNAALPPFIHRLNVGFRKLCRLNGKPPEPNLFRQQIVQAPSELQEMSASELDIIP